MTQYCTLRTHKILMATQEVVAQIQKLNPDYVFPEGNTSEPEIEKRSQVRLQTILLIMKLTNTRTRVILFAKLVDLALWMYEPPTGREITFAPQGIMCVMWAQGLARALKSLALLAMLSSFATTTGTLFHLGAPTQLITSTTSSELAHGQSTALLVPSGLVALLGLSIWSEGNSSILTTTMLLLLKTLASLFIVYIMHIHIGAGETTRK